MSGYIGNIPVPQATQSREVFTATSGQTTFATVGYPVGFVDVWLNGVKLVAGTDFTATNGSDVVLTVGAAAGDTVEVISNSTFEVNSQTFTGDTSAENFAVTGTFTSRGIDDNATSTAVTLDASGRVGVGETTPSSSLHITENEITAYNGAATDGQLGAGASLFLRQAGGSNTALSQIVFQPRTGYGYNRIVNSGGSAPYMAFATNNAERARIDASGNLLVGTTDSNPVGNNVDSGVQFGDGRIRASRVDRAVLELNRKTSDGSIAEFRKDGTTVGSVGANGGRPYFSGASSGIAFGGSSAAIWPTNASGTLVDATYDLGSPSVRFRNAYLSGGVYLGGTGAANLLQDYEEGTWTPVLGGYTGTTYTVQDGRYTKVGRLVIALCRMTIASVGTYAGNTRIAGLPFSASNTTYNDIPASAFGNATGLNFNPAGYYWGIYASGTNCYIYSSDTGGAISGNQYQAGTIGLNFIYQTS